MCGRVAQHRGPVEYGSMLKIDWTKILSPGLPNTPPHYNGAPSQDFLIARSHPETHDTTLDLIRWGLLPSWAKDQKIAWKLINARAETVATAPAFTIITTDANDLVRELHDRMPVVIGADDRDRWLNGDDPQDLLELLRPYPAELMTMWPVSMRVNSPKNDDPSLLERVDDDDAERGLGSDVGRANEGAPGRKPANSD
jgi:putative SOS response-associated peptidase YedK